MHRLLQIYKSTKKNTNQKVFFYFAALCDFYHLSGLPVLLVCFDAHSLLYRERQIVEEAFLFLFQTTEQKQKGVNQRVEKKINDEKGTPFHVFCFSNVSTGFEPPLCFGRFATLLASTSIIHRKKRAISIDSKDFSLRYYSEWPPYFFLCFVRLQTDGLSKSYRLHRQAIVVAGSFRFFSLSLSLLLSIHVSSLRRLLKEHPARDDAERLRAL